MSAVTLLDGGMGQELVHRTGDRPTPLWATQVMIDHPGLVAQIHRDFTAAGATVATTNTYAIHHDRLRVAGLQDSFAELHQLALSEAQNGGAYRIAGAIGPLGASYRPDLHPPADEAAALYKEVAKQLFPHCDLLILESVASVIHAASSLAGTSWAGIPIWLALTVDDKDGTRLRSGELLADVIPAAQAGAQAVLINCASPEAIPAGLDILAQSGLPYGAYANGFEQISDGFLQDNPTVDTLTLRKDFTPALYADHVMSWVDQGATIVGGCCEVGPAHIAEIATRLRAAGHTIV